MSQKLDGQQIAAAAEMVARLAQLFMVPVSKLMAVVVEHAEPSDHEQMRALIRDGAERSQALIDVLKS